MKTIIHASEVYDTNCYYRCCIMYNMDTTLQTTIKYVLIALRRQQRRRVVYWHCMPVRKHKRKWLYIAAIIGASTVADGIITPSITVVSAIEGLKAADDLRRWCRLVITIISVLFFIQQFGTKC